MSAIVVGARPRAKVSECFKDSASQAEIRLHRQIVELTVFKSLQATRLQATRLQATRLQEDRMKFRPTLMDLEARTVPTVDPTGYDPNAVPVQSNPPPTNSSPDQPTQTGDTNHIPPRPWPMPQPPYIPTDEELNAELAKRIADLAILKAQYAVARAANVELIDEADDLIAQVEELDEEIADAKKAGMDTTALQKDRDAIFAKATAKTLEVQESEAELGRIAIGIVETELRITALEKWIARRSEKV